MAFKVTFTYARDVSFFVDAESEKAVHDFLMKGGGTWQPADVQGLVDLVGEEEELGYEVEKHPTITANFRITEGGELEEKA